MIVDGSQLASGIEKEHEICVVGSGIAGMVLMTELAPTSQDICLVESGAWQPDHDTQSLYNLTTVGYPVRENFQNRIRYFGGSCNIWAGRAVIYHDIDMRPRPWIDGICWPLDFEELDAYYARASEYLHLPAYDMFKPEHWKPKLSDFEMNFFQSETFQPNVVLFAKAPARFGYKTAYYQNIKKAHNITTYIRVVPQ